MKLLSINMQSVRVNHKKILKMLSKFIKNNAYLLFSKEEENAQAKMEAAEKEVENRMNAIKIARRIIVGDDVSLEDENLLKEFNSKWYLKIKEKFIRKNS